MTVTVLPVLLCKGKRPEPRGVVEEASKQPIVLGSGWKLVAAVWGQACDGGAGVGAGLLLQPNLKVEKNSARVPLAP